MSGDPVFKVPNPKLNVDPCKASYKEMYAYRSVVDARRAQFMKNVRGAGPMFASLL